MNNVDQTASGNKFINSTIIKGLTDQVRPVDQLSRILFIQYIESLHQLNDDFFLNRNSGVFLFDCNRESFEEGLVEDIGSDEPTIF